MGILVDQANPRVAGAGAIEPCAGTSCQVIQRRQALIPVHKLTVGVVSMGSVRNTIT